MNAPKLRFKADDGSEFPDWEEKKYSSVCNVFADGDWIESKNQSDSGIRLIQTRNIGNGIFIDRGDKKKYISKETFDRLKCKEVFEGDILISRLPSPAGRACIVPKLNERMITAVDCTIVRTDKSIILHDYCVQFMQSSKHFYYVASMMSGGTRRRISRKNLENELISFPCLPEQQKIADFLATIDTVIEKQKETVSAWEERKKGVMQKLFSQEVRFKADDGSQFPDWEEKKLGDCGRFYTGVGFSKKYQGHKGLDVDVYKVSDMNIIGNEKYMTLSNNTVDDSIVGQMKTKIITSKCLVFAKVGAAIYGERKRITTKPFLIDNNMMTFEPYSCLNIEYLHSWSCSVKFSQYAQVGALPSYNSSDIGIIKIHIPCLEEQQKIADCLSSFDEVIEKQKATLATWKELKKGLLQRIFV